MGMWKGLAVMGAAALAAACGTMDAVERLTASAPGVAEGVERASYEAVPEVPERGDWTAVFQDDTLIALVTEAYGANFELAAAEAQLRQARAGVVEARSSLFPFLSLRGNRSQNEFAIEGSLPTEDVNGDGLLDQNDVIAGGATTNTVTIASSDIASLTLNASWELDFWGRLRDQAGAGAADLRAAQADLADARLSIGAAVAQAWYRVIQAKALTALAADDVATQARSLRLTERRFEAGLAGSLDVRLARSALASSEASLIQQSAAQRSAERSLEVLLGRYPAAAIEAADTLPALPPLPDVGAPGDLLARRPDLRVAEAQLDAAGLRAAQARKALLPQLTLSASYGTDGDDFDDVLDPDFLVTSLAGSLLQPVFQGGALRASARRAEAAAEAALYAYAAQALTAYEEAENALDNETALADREAALLIAEEEALAAEALAEREYTRGVGTIFELLDAQRRRISAQRELILVRQERVSNRVSLYVAIGGDYITQTRLEEQAAQTAEEKI